MDVWVKTIMAEIYLPKRPGFWDRFWHCWVRGAHRWVPYGDDFPRRKCLRCGLDLRD